MHLLSQCTSPGPFPQSLRGNRGPRGLHPLAGRPPPFSRRTLQEHNRAAREAAAASTAAERASSSALTPADLSLPLAPAPPPPVALRPPPPPVLPSGPPDPVPPPPPRARSSLRTRAPGPPPGLLAPVPSTLPAAPVTAPVPAPATARTSAALLRPDFTRFVARFYDQPIPSDVRPPSKTIIDRVHRALDAIPTSQHVRLVGAEWNPSGNLIFSFPTSLSTRSITAVLPVLRTALQVPLTHPLTISQDVKWAKVILGRVIMRDSPAHPLFTDAQLLDGLSVNPHFLTLHLTQLPRWLRRPESISSDRSSITFAFEDPDGSLLQQFCARPLFLFGAPSAGNWDTSRPLVRTDPRAAYALLASTRPHDIAFIARRAPIPTGPSTRRATTSIAQTAMGPTLLTHWIAPNGPSTTTTPPPPGPPALAWPRPHPHRAALLNFLQSQLLRPHGLPLATPPPPPTPSWPNPNAEPFYPAAQRRQERGLRRSDFNPEGTPIINPPKHPSWTCYLPVADLDSPIKPHVLIYVRTSLPGLRCQPRPDLFHHKDILALDVWFHGFFFRLVNLYNYGPGMQADSCCRLISIPPDPLVPTAVCGDFNLHHPLWSYTSDPRSSGSANELVDWLDTAPFFLYNDTTVATHRGNRVSLDSTIDLTLLNHLALSAGHFSSWQAMDDPAYSSDHYPITFSVSPLGPPLVPDDPSPKFRFDASRGPDWTAACALHCPFLLHFSLHPLHRLLTP
ncbi:hypothetical protein M0805_003460 [Coniferiporia weirii]|nr:hypothetical protein M0805_003460 [Coniferiporia weirii]